MDGARGGLPFRRARARCTERSAAAHDALRRATRDLTNMLARAGIEDLREKREELNRSILRDEEEKAKIQKARGGGR